MQRLKSGVCMQCFVHVGKQDPNLVSSVKELDVVLCVGVISNNNNMSSVHAFFGSSVNSKM